MKNQSATQLCSIAATLAAMTAPVVHPASAQESPALSQNIEEVVVTAGRREQSILDVQASIDVITEDDILRFTGASVTEVLRQSVGVDARTSGANSTVAIRGQIPNAGSSVLLLYNGLPRTGKFGISNLNNFAVSDVERVEIIRGPMSALYGANAAGGVVNVITRRPGEGSPLAMRVLGGTSLTDSGDGRETTAVSLSSNFRTGNAGHRVSLDWRRADPFRFDTTAREDDLSGIDHLSLAYSGVVDTGKTGRLGWWLEGFSQDDRFDGLTRTGEAFERYEQEDRIYGALTYDLEIGPGSLTLEGSHGYSDGAVNRSFPRPEETTEFTQTMLQGRYFLPLNDHNLLFGAGAQSDEIDVSILTEVGEETNLFAFAQDEWDLGGRFRLVAGLRVDEFDAFGTQVIPRLSFGSRDSRLSWRVGYGEAFRAPSVIEQFSRFNRGRFLIVGSPDIQPEESETWEAAVAWRGARGSIEVIYHDSEISNLIQAAPNGAMIDGLLVFAYQNIREADISGVEVSGSYTLGAGFNIDVAYEYLDATDGETGDRLNGRARNTLRLGLGWNYGPWNATLRGRHIDDLWGINPADRRSPAFASEYTVADLQMRYQLSPQLHLSIGVENLFDELTPDNWAGNGAIEDPAGRYGYLAFNYDLGGQP